jgi:hypothetical protein
MCPSCGLSLAGYPSDGKCSKCGAVIGPSQDRPTTEIDAEIARFREVRKVCPTCGKPLPVGTNMCPACTVIDEPHAKPRISGLVKLGILAAFAIVAAIVVWTLMQRWGYEQHAAWAKGYVEQARQDLTEDKVRDAEANLRSAGEQVGYLRPEDPRREELTLEIESTRKTLWEKAQKKLQEMIGRDEVEEALAFYESEVKFIDGAGTLRKQVDKAVEQRKMLQGFKRDLKQAQKLRDEGAVAEAIKQMYDLRKKVQDPLRSRDPLVAQFRRSVEDLQNAWIKETKDKGDLLVGQGKLAEAAKWHELGLQYVWGTEVALRRALQDALYQISEKRVVGVIVDVSQVRVVQPETVKQELTAVLTEKLASEGFLGLVLNGSGDPVGAELDRVILIDYSESKGREFRSDSGGEKVVGTRISCSVKVLAVRGGSSRPLWETSVSSETGTIVGGAPADFNDATLRLNAVGTFRQAFAGVRIPGLSLRP